MNDADALLRAILADPADDLPRLMYADEIEADEPEWAEFIRVQCELPKLEAFAANRALYSSDSLPGDKTDQLIALRRRESELWPRVVGSFDLPGGQWLIDIHPRGTDKSALVRRGFVESVRLSLAVFAGGPCGRCRVGPPLGPWPCSVCSGTGRAPGIAPALFESQPVTAVTLTDREPSEWSGELGATDFVWTVRTPNQIEIPGDLPRELFRLLTGGSVNRDNWHRNYPTRAAALDSLSAACVAWGRGLAGLPPLKLTAAT